MKDRTGDEEERFTEEQMIGIVMQHEAGMKTADLCREDGISAAAFYAWTSKYGGMDGNEAQRLRQSEEHCGADFVPVIGEANRVIDHDQE